MRFRLTFPVFLLIMLVLIIIAALGSYFYTEWLWFTELGYSAVFAKSLLAKLLVGLVTGVISALVIWIGLRLAVRAMGEVDVSSLEPPFDAYFAPRQINAVILGLSALLGLAIGWSGSSHWLAILRLLDRVEFGQVDPIFGRDIGFYVFVLPIYKLAYQYLSFVVIIVILGGLSLFAVSGAIGAPYGRFSITQGAKAYLSLWIGIYLVIKAFGYWLNAFGLLQSPRGVTFGAGYTDIHANLPALRVLMVLSLVGAVVLWFTARRRDLRLFWGVPIGLIGASIVIGAIYPALVQQFSVSPNELAREAPYIRNNIALTRQAYGLDKIVDRNFDVNETLTYEDVQGDRATIGNVRVWDWRPLLQTYSQLQEIRPYYRFQDVDVDRYVINGRLRQVMISARELEQGRLPAEAQTWVNTRLKFTHGYGVVFSPSNEFTKEGLPNFWVKDIPPSSTIDFKISRPEIYYGEATRGYVVVGTLEPEFDYPLGDENKYTTYEGSGGIPVGSFSNRLALAFRLSDYRLLFTRSITPDSRVMFRRDIMTRVRAVAPFLVYDNDPYVVVDSEGKLLWIIDAYTFTNEYPYSEPISLGGYDGVVNYLRNSVKVVIDAYNGTTNFYVFDEADPLVKTYSKIFPSLFKPKTELREDIARHVRYPELLFRVQSEMFARYHMTDPTVFYNKEDLWQIPTEIYAGDQRRMEPYYVIMRLPGEQEAEFIQIMPYTPANKQNMIAWLASRSDGEHYGEVLAFRFPKDRLVFGPMQVEARINQDAEISQLLTLWGQMGSRVIRGNLLVIPIKQSILYIEPLYLQAEDSQLPELKRVIVAYGNAVAMGETLDDALRKVFGVRVSAPTRPEARVTPKPVGRLPELPQGISNRELIDRANELFKRAQERVREGDWEGFGRALNELGKVLERLSGGDFE